MNTEDVAENGDTPLMSTGDVVENGDTPRMSTGDVVENGDTPMQREEREEVLTSKAHSTYGPLQGHV